MKTLFLLAVALIIAELPPAFALNCTLYEGEQNELCGVVNPLELSDSEKESLMQPSIYGNIEPDNSPIVLNLNMPDEQLLTLDSVYEEKLALDLLLSSSLLTYHAPRVALSLLQYSHHCFITVAVVFYSNNVALVKGRVAQSALCILVAELART